MVRVFIQVDREEIFFMGRFANKYLRHTIMILMATAGYILGASTYNSVFNGVSWVDSAIYYSNPKFLIVVIILVGLIDLAISLIKFKRGKPIKRMR